MVDEKTKVVTDTTGPDAGSAPLQPEAGGGAPAPKQEQPAPEAVSPDKAEAPAQEAPAQDKAADAPKEQKAASVSVFNFSEIMAEKKATERAAAQQEAKAPEKAASPVPSKEAGPKQEEQSQSPKRRGRPPKADKEKNCFSRTERGSQQEGQGGTETSSRPETGESLQGSQARQGYARGKGSRSG